MRTHGGELIGKCRWKGEDGARRYGSQCGNAGNANEGTSSTAERVLRAEKRVEGLPVFEKNGGCAKTYPEAWP